MVAVEFNGKVPLIVLFELVPFNAGIWLGAAVTSDDEEVVLADSFGQMP